MFHALPSGRVSLAHFPGSELLVQRVLLPFTCELLHVASVWSNPTLCRADFGAWVSLLTWVLQTCLFLYSSNACNLGNWKAITRQWSCDTKMTSRRLEHQGEDMQAFNLCVLMLKWWWAFVHCLSQRIFFFIPFLTTWVLNRLVRSHMPPLPTLSLEKNNQAIRGSFQHTNLSSYSNEMPGTFVFTVPWSF